MFIEVKIKIMFWDNENMILFKKFIRWLYVYNYNFVLV